ncbi:MAG: hypothetical protein U1E23_15135 [Reyranellaceae bacterium]
MTTHDRLAGAAILLTAFAMNVLHNHTALAAGLRGPADPYPIVFFIGVGTVLPALLLARVARRDAPAARALGLAAIRRPAWRDAGGVLAAVAVAIALTWLPLSPLVHQPGGAARLLALFSQLLVASIAEVALFVGMTGVCLRGLGGDPDGWRAALLLVALSSLLFGLFHFTYPAPWNTPATALTVGLVWLAVSGLFVLTRSLLGAVLLDNAMATVGFATRGLELPLSPAVSLLLAGLAVAAFALIVRRIAR